MICSVCGGTDYKSNPVLWDDLCREWQLSPEERAYVDRQQGTCCTTCGSNIRSNALSRAIVSAAKTSGLLCDWVKSDAAQHVHLLELNGAGNLSPVLSQLPGHKSGDYPAIDMHALPYGDSEFDYVVHSDTLEHVADPIHALGECRRVLKPGGVLAFTVPVIVGRLSRNRSGLALSFHGSPSTTSADFAVVTEYGSDMWTHVIQAGFDAVTIHTVDYPAATAMAAIR